MADLQPYKLVAVSNPAEGADEEAFGKWYDEIHLPDVLALDGVQKAQRFKLVRAAPSSWVSKSYMCIYDFEAAGDEDAAGLITRMNKANIPLSDTLDVSSVNLAVYKPVGPEVTSE